MVVIYFDTVIPLDYGRLMWLVFSSSRNFPERKKKKRFRFGSSQVHLVKCCKIESLVVFGRDEKGRSLGRRRRKGRPYRWEAGKLLDSQ